MDDAQLRTVWQQRQRRDSVTPLAQPLTQLVERTLAKRVRQFGSISQAWDDVMPESVRDHTALEGYQRGTLTVMVDSASHRFKLQTLLDGGLKNQIQSRCSQPINKIRLTLGQFYQLDPETGERRYGFS
ncbi:MAG: DciA family protein [Planctomycetota bacterium]|jgi:hypothetical protein